MSGLQLGAILAGLLGLAALGRWQRRDEARLADPERARTLASERLAGFVAGRALTASDGNTALVAGNGTLALLQRRGVRVTARRLIPPLALSDAIEGVGIESDGATTTLFGVAGDQVRALEAEAAQVYWLAH